MPNKQLLHLVFGGQLVRPDATEFVDPSKLHIVGIFPSYAEAYSAWRGASAATIDDAHMRYFASSTRTSNRTDIDGIPAPDPGQERNVLVSIHGLPLTNMQHFCG